MIDGAEADPHLRVRLDVSYDGTDFSGWAVQPQRRTVQGELESALQSVLRVPSVALTVAGRTDAGVHATGQVAHLDLLAAVWAEAAGRAVRSVNGVLPPDVRVQSMRSAPAGFDARFSALWRRYEYRINDGASGAQPLSRHHVVNWRSRLDVDAMRESARRLLGLHDFAAFCRHRAAGTSIRTLQHFDVARDEDDVVFAVQADAFCHSMVRSLVGALTAVGEQRRPVEWPASLLDAERRADDVPVAPAHGLTLVEVAYPADDDLAQRAEQTRAMRTAISRR